MDPNQPTAAVPTPADQYATLKAAVLGASANTAPGASPLGNFPEIAKLYSSNAAVAQSDLNSAGPQYNTKVQVANDEAATSAARAASGAGKYQQKPTGDGGFKFYGPDGQEMSAAQFAAATGASVGDLLKDSQNPIDRAFLQDYQQLNDYINNKANAKNDPKARSAAQKVETQVRKLYGIQLHQQNPNQVIQAFVQAYPTVYGGHTAGRQGTSTLLPSANTIKTSSSGSFGAGGGIPE